MHRPSNSYIYIYIYTYPLAFLSKSSHLALAWWLACCASSHSCLLRFDSIRFGSMWLSCVLLQPQPRHTEAPQDAGFFYIRGNSKLPQHRAEPVQLQPNYTLHSEPVQVGCPGLLLWLSSDVFGRCRTKKTLGERHRISHSNSAPFRPFLFFSFPSFPHLAITSL